MSEIFCTECGRKTDGGVHCKLCIADMARMEHSNLTCKCCNHDKTCEACGFEGEEE